MCVCVRTPATYSYQHDSREDGLSTRKKEKNLLEVKDNTGLEMSFSPQQPRGRLRDDSTSDINANYGPII